MKHCKDCEPAQESHFVAYMSVLLGFLCEPFFNFMEMLFKKTTDAITNKYAFSFFKFLDSLGFGHLSAKLDEADSLRTKCLWQEAEKRGIKMREYHIGPMRDIFLAEYKNKKMVFEGLPRPSGTDSKSLVWMDDKGIMKTKFQRVGLPVAKGGVASSKSGALKIFRNIEKPVITKPNFGSRSRHTSIHLNTEADLIMGFKKAKKLSPFVVIEQELSGDLFRGTLIGGKLVGVMRRDKPQVTGDGVHTVRELVAEENKRLERSGPIFHEIKIDENSEIELKRQGLALDSIPEKGLRVTLSQKTSRGCGGTTTEIYENIHPENTKMLEHVAEFLDDPLVGVDFIMEDIEKSWKEQSKSGIIECNSLPFIDLHHYPLFGAPNNVAGKLWDLVMPESK